MQLEGIYKRTSVYQHIDYNNPKYLFTLLGDKIDSFIDSKDFSLLDVGGASGAFCYYISKRFPQSSTTCLEYDEELCEIGKNQVPCNFICGDAENMTAIKDNTYDIVTMIGVLSIFDDFKKSISECLRVVRRGG